MSRLASDGWERWPIRKTLDGTTYLCRWCAKPLKGQCTAYCSDECSGEIFTRCTFASLRRRLFSERGGICEGCGIDINALTEFFSWYRRTCRKYEDKIGNYQLRFVEQWPFEHELRESLGYKGQNDFWECNHKLALAEGGNLVDPDNLEILCLKCHRKHTAALRRRLAKKSA